MTEFYNEKSLDVKFSLQKISMILEGIGTLIKKVSRDALVGRGERSLFYMEKA